MGCTNAKERIENRICILKLVKFKIQKERNKELKKLQLLEGTTIFRPKVPDYILNENKEIDVKQM